MLLNSKQAAAPAPDEQHLQLCQSRNEQIVHQHCYPLFNGANQRNWHLDAVRRLILTHATLLKPLFLQLDTQDLVQIVKSLLRKGAFPGHSIKGRSKKRRKRRKSRLSESGINTLPALLAVVNVVADRCPVNSGEGSSATSLPSSDSFFLPYSVQHKILVHLQNSLEQCCYDFVQREKEEFFTGFSLDCSLACRLSRWLDIVREHPTMISMLNDPTLRGLTTDLRNLERTVTLRTPIRASVLFKFLSSSIGLAEVLDPGYEQSETITICVGVREELRQATLDREVLRKAVQGELEGLAVQRDELTQKVASLIDNFSSMCMISPHITAPVHSDVHPTPLCPRPTSSTDWVMDEYIP